MSRDASRWDEVLSSVEEVFTAPSFVLFCELMGAWALVTARHTICSMVQVMDPATRGAHDAYHRFVRAGAWSLDSCLAAVCLLAVRLAGAGRLTLYLDDTLFHRAGPQVNGAANWRDAVRSTSRQGWANEMTGLLVEAKEAVEQAKAEGRDSLDASVLHSIRVRYGMLVARGWGANPAPVAGKRYGVNKKAANLLARLDGQRADVLRFATDFAAPFDNNQAERDVRMVKLQQKISGSWRTLTGARAYCTIRSYISTMRKHDADVLNGLRRMFEGNVWLPGGT